MYTYEGEEYFAYDYTLSQTAGEVDLDSGVSIGFGSGDLRGTFINDSCVLGDPYDADNQLVIGDF